MPEFRLGESPSLNDQMESQIPKTLDKNLMLNEKPGLVPIDCKSGFVYGRNGIWVPIVSCSAQKFLPDCEWKIETL